MKKRILLALIVLLIISGGLSAQDQVRAKNSIAVSFGIIGVELGYERIFNRYLSVLADLSYTTLIFMDEFTVSGKGRWYPFGRAFYLEMGLGYSYGKGVTGFVADVLLGTVSFGLYWLVKDFENDVFRTGGFLIQPGLGWKIDIGKQDRFVLPISLGLDIKTGKVPDFMPYLRIGLGYSF